MHRLLKCFRASRECLPDMQDEPVRIPVTDVLDLHSVPPRDVLGVVEEYLSEAVRLGFSCVRIIHGRGIGVQRAAVRGLLEKSEFVVNFADAPLEAGGWGATVVDLRRSPAAGGLSPNNE